MSTKITCVGFPASDLTAEEIESLERLTKHADGLLGIEVYPNLDVSDVDNIPSGVALYFDPAASVDPTMIHDRLFETTAVSKVVKGPYKANGAVADQAFTSNKALLNKCVPQYAATPVHADLRSANMNEVDTWHSELGGDGSFVGAYSQLESNHRDKSYYLVSRGTVPLIVQDFKQDVARNKPTYRQLMSNKVWSNKMKNNQYMANRNVQRNLANFAEASQVAINRIRDLGAYLPTEQHSYPVRAVPDWTQSSHSIRDAKHDGRAAVAIYSGVMPASDRRSSNAGETNTVFLVTNPYDGITAFPIKGDANESIRAFPVETGRNPTRSDHTSERNARAIKERASSVVMWENQENHSLHSDVAPDAWKPVGDTFKSVMKHGGWTSDDNTRMLVPVVVKIFNPEMDR